MLLQKVSWVFVFVLSCFFFSPVTFAQNAAQEHYARGYKNSQQGDLQNAIIEMTKAIEADPSYSEAYYARGYIHAQLRDFSAAAEDYARAIELDHRNGKAYYALASVYEEQGDLASAIEQYTKLIALDPKNASAYNSRGVVYSKQGDFVRAIADYDKAIEIDSAFVRPHYNRGLAASIQGKDDEALANYTRALEIDPRSADALNNRGLTYARKGDHQAAISDFSQAIELFPIETNPHHTPPYMGRANSYFAQKEYALAAEDCSRIIRCYPQDVAAYVLRARAYSLSGEIDRAWEDVNRLRALGVSVPADFMRELGRMTSVAEEMAKFGLAFDPPEGWSLFLRSTDSTYHLLGSLQVRTYSYMSPDGKALLLVTLPVAMPDRAFQRILTEVRAQSPLAVEEQITLAGAACSVFTRVESTEYRRKTVSYHFYKDGKAHALAFIALESEYVLYRDDLEKAIARLRFLPAPVDGRVFHVNDGSGRAPVSAADTRKGW